MPKALHVHVIDAWTAAPLALFYMQVDLWWQVSATWLAHAYAHQQGEGLCSFTRSSSAQEAEQSNSSGLKPDFAHVESVS